MIILSIIGKSNSGKTTLILKLLPELKKKGYKVAVAKHCPSGFDLDAEGKDSWKFAQAGSNGIFLSSPEKEAIVRPMAGKMSLKEKLLDYFSDFDIVLMEGYKKEPGIKKIQVLRNEAGGNIITSNEIIAYITDMDIETDKRVLNVNDIEGMISFIEKIGDRRLSTRDSG